MKQLYFEFISKQEDHIIVSNFNKFAYNTLVNVKNGLHNVIYLYGDEKVGKTSLVLSCLNKYKGLILKQFDDINTIILQKYMQEVGSSIIFIDNLTIMSEKEEQNLFNLYNFIKSYNYNLIITSRSTIQELNIALPDLQSRLLSSLIINIKNPSDEELRKILFQILQDKQIVITNQVVNYIFNNVSRTLPSIINVVDKIEDYINTNKKSITLKSLKEVL